MHRRAKWHTKIGHVLALAAAVAAVLGPLVPAVALSQSIPAGFQEFHVLGDEQHAWDMYNRVATAENVAGEFNDAMLSVVSVVVSTDGQRIYYDHWEDGFDAELEVVLSGGTPGTLQSTTLVFGDGDPSNGDACDFSGCTPDTDLINRGDVLPLDSDGGSGATSQAVVITITNNINALDAGVVVLNDALAGTAEQFGVFSATGVANPGNVSTALAAGTANAWLVDVVSAGEAGTFAPGAAQTSQWVQSSAQMVSEMSTEPNVGAGSNSMAWTFTATGSPTNRLAQGAARFAPAAASTITLNSTSTSTDTTTTLTTFSHTLAAGSNRKIIVGVSLEDGSGSCAADTLPSVTFAGVAMTRIAGASSCVVSGFVQRVELYFLDEASLPAIPQACTPPGGETLPASRYTDANIRGCVPVNPRNTNDIRFDGGDRIVTTGGPTGMVHAQEPEMRIASQGIIAGAVEMISRQTVDNATSYSIPVGEDLYVAAGDATSPFKYTELDIVAFADGTTVTVDNGLDSSSFSLDKGQHWRSGCPSAESAACDDLYSILGPSGPNVTTPASGSSLVINSGTKISTNQPISGLLFTGSDNNYQTRVFAILPDLLHGTDYVTTAPGDNPGINGNRPANLYVFNPDPVNSIQVSATDSLGSFSFTVPPNAQVDYNTAAANATGSARFPPGGSTVRLSSNRNFWGISAYDHAGTGSDWGHSWLATKFLTGEYSVAYAPDLASASVDAAPVHVTATQDNTCVRVDFDNDGVFDDIGNGAGGTTARNSGGTCDGGYVINALQSLPVFDNTDPIASQDNAGTRIRADKPVAVAYGQHTDFSPAAGTNLRDFGYTVYPVNPAFLDIVVDATKTASPTSIALNTANNTVTYTIKVSTSNFGPLSAFSIVDQLPLNGSPTYVPGSSVITFPDLSQSTTDPVQAAGTLTWDLNPGDGGSTTTTMLANQTLTISYAVDLDSGTSTEVFTNEITASGTLGGSTFSTTAEADVVTTGVVLTKEVLDPISLTSIDGDNVEPNDVLRYRITVNNTDAIDESNPVVRDLVPAGTSFCDSTISAACQGITGTGIFSSGGAYDSAQNTVAWTPTPTTAITFDAQSSDGASDITSLGMTHSLGGGTSRKMLVGVSIEENGACTVGVSNITFTQVAAPFSAFNMTAIPGADACVDTGFIQNVEMWYVDVPDTAAAGDYTIAVTLSTQVDELIVGAVSLNDASTGSPETAGATTATNATAISTPIGPGSDGAWLVDIVSSGTTGGTFTAGTNQTSRWDFEQPDQGHAAMSTEPNVSVAANDMSWAHSSSANRLAHGAVRIVPASPPLTAFSTETLTFDVRVDPATSAGTVVPNAAAFSSDSTISFNSNEVEVVVVGPQLTISKSVVGNPNPLHPNEFITYEIAVRNDGAGSAHNVTIDDLLPSNATYQAGNLQLSLNSGLFTALTETATTPLDVDDEGEFAAGRVRLFLTGSTNFADDFDDDSPSANGNEYDDQDGNGNFTTDWTETNDDNDDGNGEIQIDTVDNELVLGPSNGVGGAPSIERAVALGGFASASLRFTFDIVGTVEANDTVQLRAFVNTGVGSCAVDGTVLETFTGFTGADPVTNAARSYDLTPFIDAVNNTVVCYVIASEYTGAGEALEIDNFVIRGGAALAPGEDIRLRFRMQVNAATGGQNLDNQAQITAAELSPKDTTLLSIPIVGDASITGTVFIDDGSGGGTAGDGIQNGTEAGAANVDVVITDINGGVQTVVTDSSGDFSVVVPPGLTTVDVDGSDPQIPANHSLSTGNDPQTITAIASATVDISSGSGDFGFAPTNLSIAKANAPGIGVAAGDTIQYTLSITAAAAPAVNHTGVVVSDTLPAGTSYVPFSTLITFPNASTSTDEPDTGTPGIITFDLDPGAGTTTTLNATPQTLTITYLLRVDDPLALGTTSVTNSATITTTQNPDGLSDIATNTILPAVSVGPNGAATVFANGSQQIIDFFHAVSNDGVSDDSFALNVSGDSGWIVELIDPDTGAVIATDSDLTTLGWDGGATPNTGTLSADGTREYLVRAKFLGATTAGTQSTVTLSATSTRDGTVADSASDEIAIVDGSVLPADAGKVLLTPDNADVAAPGDTVVYTHTVTNNTGANDTFNLTSVNSVGTWSTLFFADSNGDGIYTPGVDSQITQSSTLANGASQRIFAVVHVPTGAADNEVNVSSVSAVSQTADCTDPTSCLIGFASDTTTVQVPTTAGPVTLDPDGSATVNLGATASYVHTLSNDSGAQHNFELVADGTKLWVRDLLVDTTGDGIADTVIAQDTDGDGDWDVITTGSLGTTPIVVTDSDGDGNPEIQLADGAAVVVEVRVTVPGGATNGAVDATTLTATAIDNALLTDTITDTTRAGVVQLETDNSAFANPGTTVNYDHTLSNDSGGTQQFAMVATGTQSWPRNLLVDTTGNGTPDTIIAQDTNGDGVWDSIITGSLGTIVVSDVDGDGIPEIELADGASVALRVQVLVPGGALAGDVDTTTLTAVAIADATLRDVAVDVTTVGLVQFKPDNARTAAQGQTVIYDHALTNNTGATDTFDITLGVTENDWPRTLVINGALIARDTNGDGVWDFVDYDGDGTLEAFSTTPACATACANDADNDGDPDVSLANGASADIEIRIQVASGATDGDVDTTTITASGQVSGAVASAENRTTVSGLFASDLSGGGSHVVIGGTTDVFPGTLSNQGDFTDTFEMTISASDYGPGGAVADGLLHPTVLRIDSNGDGIVDLTDAIIATDTEGDGVWNSINTGTFGAFTVADADGDGDPEIQLTSGQPVPYALFRAVDLLQGAYRDPVTLASTSSASGEKNSVTATTALLLATRAIIGSVLAFDGGGAEGIVVEWHTLAEHGTVGFHVERLNVASGEYQRINDKLLPGLLHSRYGGAYRLHDPVSSVGELVSYQLVELEATGNTITYGPFEVLVEPARPANAPEITAEGESDRPAPGFERVARAMSALTATRITDKKAARKAAKREQQQRTGQLVKITVRESGLYLLDTTTIAAAMGESAKAIRKLIAGNGLRLENRGAPIATIAAARNAGIYFYATAIDSQYTADNVYLLRKARGLRMQTRNASRPKPVAGQVFIDSVHAEGNRYTLTHLFDDPDGDYWMWDFRFEDLIFPMFDASFSVPSAGVASASKLPAVLTVRLHGGSETDREFDHKARIVLNGTELGTAEWDGLTAHKASFTVDVKLLNDGDNSVEIFGTASGIADQPSTFYINDFDLSYPRRYLSDGATLSAANAGHRTLSVEGFASDAIRVFDITTPSRPQALRNLTIDGDSSNFRASFRVARSQTQQFLAVTPEAVKTPLSVVADQPSKLRSEAHQIDHLTITSSDMLEAAQGLADYRATQGLRSMVVDIEDIYDEFSDGIRDADAIWSFLHHAVSHWRTAPRYVVLAGEGSHDYKNHLGFGDSVIPTLLTPTPNGLSPSDNLFADVLGNDFLPELAVGRLPVINAAELAAVVKKIIDYEAASGPWASAVTMSADPLDLGGDFPASSDSVAELLPPEYSTQKIHVGDIGAAAARLEMLAGLDEGRAFVNFFGHGSFLSMGNSTLLSAFDVPGMTNKDRLPVLTAFTCLVGQFGLPGQESLGERLMVESANGAIAVWAPSGLSLNDRANLLAEGFYGATFGAGELVLGETILKAQKHLLKNSKDPYLLDIYNLIGDPATVMK